MVTFHVKHSNQFVVDLLTTLQQERFSPLGWWHFLSRSWEMAQQTANAHPALKSSWVRVTLFIGVLAIVIFSTSLFFEGPTSALRLLPSFLSCVIWQQSDLFWHLGLHRQAHTDELLPTIGIANTLTWLRGLAASFLLARLIGGISTSSSLVLLVFLAGVLTDILDGPIARYSKTQSKLGQIGDSEADFYLYAAITLILLQNHVLPLWLALVMLLRFLLLLLAAVVNYFLFAHPLHFGSTLWGKLAGLAQTLYFLVLLAPVQFAFITHLVNMPLLIVLLILLTAAPTAQIIRNMLPRSTQTE